MTFLPLTSYSDFPTDQTFHQYDDLDTGLDIHRITSGFHGAFATGVGNQQGTLTLPDTWFRPPFGDLLMLQLLRPNVPKLSYLFSTFHIKYLDFARYWDQPCQHWVCFPDFEHFFSFLRSMLLIYSHWVHVQRARGRIKRILIYPTQVNVKI